jgi:hypothetical protein
MLPNFPRLPAASGAGWWPAARRAQPGWGCNECVTPWGDGGGCTLRCSQVVLGSLQRSTIKISTAPRASTTGVGRWRAPGNFQLSQPATTAESSSRPPRAHRQRWVFTTSTGRGSRGLVQLTPRRSKLRRQSPHHLPVTWGGQRSAGKRGAPAKLVSGWDKFRRRSRLLWESRYVSWTTNSSTGV